MFWRRWKPYILSVLIALAVGGAGALATHSGMEVFEQVSKPPLSPPGWLFPIVWTVLYTLMGISAAMVYTSDAPESEKHTAIQTYALNLVLNFGWTVLFFGFGLYLAAFVWLIVLWIVIALMAVRFGRIRRIAGLLQIPYLVWVAFAGYLNLGIFLLNR